jgi:hypothetical protein
MFWKLLVERCARAAVAAAIGVTSTQLAAGTFDGATLRTLAISAIAAGVSAVLSLLSRLIGDPASTSFSKFEVGP